MKNKVYLSSVALLIGGIALSGCAPKQAWSPELEDARAAYQRASSNPLVTSLAVAELDEAQRQLRAAEDAADYFKGREVIAHEATLAQLKAAEAEQAARSLQAKENLRLAQAGAPIPQASPNPLAIPDNTPTIAAARHHNGSHAGSKAGGSSPEVQQIAMQLAALSNQIAQLQSRVAGGALQNSTGGEMQTEYADPMASYDQSNTQLEQVAEPSLGAARSAQDNGAIYIESGNDAQPSTISNPLANPLANAPAVVSDARLREELRAMNARPSESGMALTLGERYFESGSARLWNGRAARHLDNVAAVMVENPGLVIEIEAHTDNQGSAESKNNLTADRAISIKSALVLRGVDGSRINTTGYGDSSPIAENSTSLGRLQNRRVEIIFPNVDGI